MMTTPRCGASSSSAGTSFEGSGRLGSGMGNCGLGRWFSRSSSRRRISSMMNASSKGHLLPDQISVPSSHSMQSKAHGFPTRRPRACSPSSCITASPERDQLAGHTANHASNPTRTVYLVGQGPACVCSWSGAVELLCALLEAEEQAGESLLRERPLQRGSEGRGEAHLDRVGRACSALRGALERPGSLVAPDELSAQQLPIHAQRRLLDVQEGELDGLHL